MLSEALTAWPYAFIIREPDLGKNILTLRPGDREFLLQQGIDIDAFVRYRQKWAFLQRRLRWAGYRQDYMIRAFKTDLLPELYQQVTQVGVKEVHNLGWDRYLKHFPEMRVIVVARDPRDIYISNYKRQRQNMVPYNQMKPAAIASKLNQEWVMQQQIAKQTSCYWIRYEDLCLCPELIHDIKTFVDSPVRVIGEIGQFISKHPDRRHEHEVHGSKISEQSVQWWKKESDEMLVESAQKVFAFMPEYCDFWGYETDTLQDRQDLNH